MAFHVPDKSTNLFDEVVPRFRVLLKQRVITGIDETRFEQWLGNFESEEECYFAACLLNRLVFRSSAMIESSFDQLLHCIIPSFLRKKGLFPYQDIDSFLNELRTPNLDCPIRFIGVDGDRPTDTGKSGPMIIRMFKQRAKINNSLTLRADSLKNLPDVVKCLIFLDDTLGTGKQFSKFAKLHSLAENKTQLLFCPLVAYTDGIQKLRDEHDSLVTLPVETLDSRHRFFSESSKKPGFWNVDESNTVEDAREFSRSLAEKHGISTTSFCLDLLLGFEGATPNNTLSILWADPALRGTPSVWMPLLVR